MGSLLRNWRNRQREGVPIPVSLGGKGGGISAEESEGESVAVAGILDADVLRERGSPAEEDRRRGLSCL